MAPLLFCSCFATFMSLIYFRRCAGLAELREVQYPQCPRQMLIRQGGNFQVSFPICEIKHEFQGRECDYVSMGI
jgi:hypothetical protein